MVARYEIKRASGVGLRIHVQYDHPDPLFGEAGTQVDRGRRLTDASLLVCYGYDIHGGLILRRGNAEVCLILAKAKGKKTGLSQSCRLNSVFRSLIRQGKRRRKTAD